MLRLPGNFAPQRQCRRGEFQSRLNRLWLEIFLAKHRFVSNSVRNSAGITGSLTFRRLMFLPLSRAVLSEPPVARASSPPGV
jgi:hypothetical protein